MCGAGVANRPLATPERLGSLAHDVGAANPHVFQMVIAQRLEVVPLARPLLPFEQGLEGTNCAGPELLQEAKLHAMCHDR